MRCNKHSFVLAIGLMLLGFGPRLHAQERHPYHGDPIQLNPEFTYQKVMHIDSDEKQSAQGGAAYGPWLFQFYNAMPRVSVVNLEQRRVVQEIPLEGKPTYHCNNANFGTERYEAEDAFPLLYVSMEHKQEHKCLVFRITGSAPGQWGMELVQTITYPATHEGPMFYPNAVIDGEGGYMWLTGYHIENWHASPVNRNLLWKFRLPSVKSGDVTLKATDALERYSFPSMTATQGALFRGGKLYQVFDIGPTTYLRVFDRNKIVTELRLHEAGLNTEPESLVYWNGDLYYVTVKRDVIRLSFPK